MLGFFLSSLNSRLSSLNSRLSQFTRLSSLWIHHGTSPSTLSHAFHLLSSLFSSPFSSYTSAPLSLSLSLSLWLVDPYLFLTGRSLSFVLTQIPWRTSPSMSFVGRQRCSSPQTLFALVRRHSPFANGASSGKTTMSQTQLLMKRIFYPCYHLKTIHYLKLLNVSFEIQLHGKINFQAIHTSYIQPNKHLVFQLCFYCLLFILYWFSRLFLLLAPQNLLILSTKIGTNNLAPIVGPSTRSLYIDHHFMDFLSITILLTFFFCEKLPYLQNFVQNQLCDKILYLNSLL